MSLLIEALLRQHLVTREQVDDANAKNIGAKKPVQELLVEMGYISESALIDVCAKVFNLPVIDLRQQQIDAQAQKLISYEVAKRYGVFPLRVNGDSLVVAMSDPKDLMVLDDLRMLANLAPVPLLAAKTQIAEFTENYYQSDESLYDILKNVPDDAKIELVKETAVGDTTLQIEAGISENAPVVKLVNLILHDAVKAKASDIHIEPQEQVVKIRYRIDGDLRQIMDIPAKLQPSLISRLKVLANLDIAEKRKPQDGRIKVMLAKRKIDLRISTVPTFYGEKVVIRILDPEEANIDLAKVGMAEGELQAYSRAVSLPQGMILVTGPTGSGKTTTLYATLNFIKSPSKNVITIEDPIEYLVSGLNQIQVNPLKDVTFANGLRSILRQDPNVIFVGEIRDKDTADIAFRASLTGHLVFSTLHTNNSVASITRLLDIGLEPYLISSSILLIVAQRLVKCICPHCKEVYTPDPGLLEQFRSYLERTAVPVFYRGKGCKECGFTGYRGRTAIFEMLRFSEDIRGLINAKAPEDQISKRARDNGLRTLAESAMEKVARGVTTLEAVAPVIGVSSEIIAPAQPPAAGREKKRVLITDDEEDILKVVEKRLLNAGYDVVKARDGLEAVESAHEQKPDLIITDATMPKMNGFELIKALRSKLETAVIPIIMLTARSDKESELKGIDAGADDYITKPFDQDKLIARVGMLLRRNKQSA